MGFRDMLRDVKDTVEGVAQVMINDLPDMSGVQPISVAHPEWLDRPLRDFSVACSHNTYMGALQIGGGVAVEPLQEALALGSRGIELDVFCNNDTGEAIVAHGTREHLVSNKILFRDCIEAIMAKAFENTDDPLFLMVENNVEGGAETAECGEMMAQAVDDFIGDRLVPPDTDISDWPLRDLLGKVILMNGGYGGDGRFLQQCTIRMHPPMMENKDSRSEPDCPLPLGRIYPEFDLSRAVSLNYDWTPFAHWTWVAMNYQGGDNYLKSYLERFQQCSFVEK
mmetsp:Transcript_26335/g.47455  ORF Transcript_26335/g.47455 Transcript_26335/m.47455 type:complete len:281 (-) Transcript_26335:143-985(-)